MFKRNWAIYLCLGILLTASIMVYKTAKCAIFDTSVTHDEVALLREAYSKGEVLIQVRRVAGKEWITAANPVGDVFQEAIFPDEQWQQGDIVYLNVATPWSGDVWKNSIAFIEIPAQLVPRDPAVEAVWQLAEQYGKYRFKKLDNVP